MGPALAATAGIMLAVSADGYTNTRTTWEGDDVTLSCDVIGHLPNARVINIYAALYNGLLILIWIGPSGGTIISQESRLY